MCKFPPLEFETQMKNCLSLSAKQSVNYLRWGLKLAITHGVRPFGNV
mgnify:CR=1